MKKTKCLCMALVFTAGVVAGAALHNWCCARMTAQQQRNLARASRTIAHSVADAAQRMRQMG